MLHTFSYFYIEKSAHNNTISKVSALFEEKVNRKITTTHKFQEQKPCWFRRRKRADLGNAHLRGKRRPASRGFESVGGKGGKDDTTAHTHHAP